VSRRKFYFNEAEILKYLLARTGASDVVAAQVTKSFGNKTVKQGYFISGNSCLLYLKIP
jgi:hypothetical protein